MLHTGLPADAIDRLPTPMGVALALTKACRREDATLEEISGLVRTDPALSGRLLALANAAALGGRAVVSAEEAVGRMGLTRVSQVALAFSLIDQHGSGACRNFNYAGYWNHSLLMAACSRQFGPLQNLGNPADLFTVGLLAQIGRLGLATAFPVPYSELVAQDLNPSEVLAQERAHCGTDHLALSVDMMEHWGIPEEFARPFGRYEGEDAAAAAGTSTQAGRSRLAHGAWVLSRVLSTEGAEAALESTECAQALRWLGLDTEALRLHLQEIESVWRVWLALIARHG